MKKPALSGLRSSEGPELRSTSPPPRSFSVLEVNGGALGVEQLNSAKMIQRHQVGSLMQPDVNGGEAAFYLLRIQADALPCDGITGMLMFGKMSVGVRRMATGLNSRISSASSMNP